MLRKATISALVGAVLLSSVAAFGACAGKDNEAPPAPVDSGGTDTVVEDVKLDTKDAVVKDTALPPCEPPTPTRCGDNCVDLQTNPFSCGSCGYACTGSYSCVAGKCACAGKKPNECKSYDDAGTQLGGICVDFKTDPENCGKCLNSCSGGKCVDGACVGGA